MQLSRDPAVVDRIAGWGWQDGVRPDRSEPVWRMDAFRDASVAAYASREDTGTTEAR